ncbi:protein IN CHLOROPLAST ATPASE BIOGENESIS [Citrus sinensis]|uniref:Protein IN CHLOROPLAST ATPASE BIOGENESIS n=1 Tax=Citrus sinensis TaxID=2711 RepID=A0ACB8IGI8_CITSI|nr:protein IN CHLOROPLAST ATPASE BIOGENESIS [Citrus sinensis]
MGVMGAIHRAPCAAALPLRHVRARPIRCSSSSGHVSFIRDIAVANPPEHLDELLKVLRTRGDTIVSPGSRQGIIPLAIPLSENSSGAVTALLRWPTAPSGMEMPVVEVRKHGVWLLGKNVDQYIHRLLVEEDAHHLEENNSELYDASSEAGKKLYQRGDFAESNITNLDSYLLSKVGLFPDVLEHKVTRHFEQGDHVSALVTGEFYAKKDLFPGFGRPFVFNAEIMLKVGRISEAKDSARVALKSPWWTLGFSAAVLPCVVTFALRDQAVASIAQWEDEQIEYIKEKITEEGKQEDLKKGKAPAQIALDEAAFLLDLGSIEGTWADSLERIAECYKEGGLDEIARFILYRD